MSHRFAVVFGPSEQVRGFLASLDADETQVWGPVALAVWGSPIATRDGRAVGVLRGVVLNDQAVAASLRARGLDLPVTDHPGLAIEQVGLGGPPGLAALRWHGSLAVVHQGQRQALVARDPQGVGGLVWLQAGPLQVLATDVEAAGGLQVQGGPQVQGGLQVRGRLVPPGVVAAVGERGVQWQLARPAPENEAFLREIPPELRQMDEAAVTRGLIARVQAAVQACHRGLGGLQVEEPVTPGERWLLGQLRLPEGEAAGGRWSLVGVDSLLGEAPGPATAREPGPWPEPPPSEPVARVSESDQITRTWRATSLADQGLEAARRRARAQGQTLVAPHLDPAVLAWLGVVAAERRPRIQ